MYDQAFRCIGNEAEKMKKSEEKETKKEKKNEPKGKSDNRKKT